MAIVVLDMLGNDEYEYEVMQAAASKFRTNFRQLSKKPLVEFSGSVVKRTSKPLEEVHAELTEQGFEHTGDVLSGKVHYHENEGGLNLTVIETRRGSLVIPSGPIRGSVFGNEAVQLDINR